MPQPGLAHNTPVPTSSQELGNFSNDGQNLPMDFWANKWRRKSQDFLVHRNLVERNSCLRDSSCYQTCPNGRGFRRILSPHYHGRRSLPFSTFSWTFLLHQMWITEINKKIPPHYQTYPKNTYKSQDMG